MTPAEIRRLTRRVDRARPATAHHEAGHAISAWITNRSLGRRWTEIKRVLIRSTEEVVRGAPHIDHRGRDCGNVLAIVECSDRYDQSAEPLAVGPSAESATMVDRYFQAELIDRMAGPLAEARYRRRSQALMFLSGGEDDVLEVRELLAHRFPKNDAAQREAAQRAEAGARRIVRHPKAWEAIKVLALQMLEHRELTGPDVVAIAEPIAGAAFPVAEPAEASPARPM